MNVGAKTTPQTAIRRQTSRSMRSCSANASGKASKKGTAATKPRAVARFRRSAPTTRNPNAHKATAPTIAKKSGA